MSPLEQHTPHRWMLSTDGQWLAAPLGEDEPPARAYTFALIPPIDVPDGEQGETVFVFENKQSFYVTYYRFDGFDGLYHHHGDNWIFWDQGGRRYAITSADGFTSKAWVNIRYIMRHVVVDQLMVPFGRRRLHAVTGTLAGSRDDGLLIIGPYLSGKTVLLNMLVERGIAGELVEDDCAVIDERLVNYCLIPQRDEPRSLRALHIRAVVCLDKGAGSPEPISAEAALAWGLPIQASWPLFWLPHDSVIETAAAAPPPDVPALRLTEKPDFDQTVTAIKAMLR